MNSRKRSGYFCLVGMLMLGHSLMLAKPEKTPQGTPQAVAADAAAPGAKPMVDRDRFTARGKNETILHIAQAGRYSIQVKSGQGTRIELVDRMAGLVGSAGSEGESDGRLDIVLDKGDYKIRLFSDKKGSGDAGLKALPFREARPAADPADHPLLKELELTEATLADLEQRSYWIELKQRRVLNLEIQGRALAECRLWKDGVLWEDLQPTVTVYEPVAGKPMTHIEFHHDLNAGLYLLRCYGGPQQKWTEDKGENPIVLRLGTPDIGENGQRLLRVSPFGRDVFRVGKATNFFQLVRAEKKPTLLTVRSWKQGTPRHGEGATASITKESRDPWCKVKSGGGGDQPQIVIVSGAPGDSLELDYFKQVYWYEIRNQNVSYWLSSIHSAEGRDSLDVTAILFNHLQKTPVREQVVRVGAKKPLARRVNLLESDNIYIFVEDKGTYSIEEDRGSGASGVYQITPFMIFRPEGYREPPFQDAGREWVLDAGYHVLSIRPKSRGILHFALQQKRDFLANPLKAIFSAQPDSLKEKPGAAGLGFFWPDVSFSLYTGYWLYINERSLVESGIIFRQLPLDLDEPLPVTLGPGQSVSVRARVSKPGTVEISGGQAQLSANGATVAIHAELAPGEYTLEMKSTDQASRVFNLFIVPVPAPPTKPLVKRIEEVLPSLEEGKPQFADFTRGQTREFLLRVQEPAFYRLETTGLIATSLKVRSLVIASLFAERENGIGRNALVQQYLKPGAYIVAVQALGRTRGRAGLQLRRTPLAFSEELVLDGISRKRVGADAAGRYHFRIPQTGNYRLQTLGLGKAFAFRLEEDGGWPVVTSEKREAIEQEFSPGSYTYYSLPDPVDSRRVTSLQQILAEKPVRGKGPHKLELNKSIENIWMETADRKPDVYRISIAAPIKARMTVEKDLLAVLSDGRDRELARSRGGDWQGDLAAGQYRVQVQSIEKTNRLPYTLTLSTTDFIPGMRRTIDSLPARLEVSIGETGITEITSFGRQDCRATLWDKASGAMIAESDDMAADWNFLISKELKAGHYQLLIESMTPETVPFDATLQMRAIRQLAECTLPISLNEKIGRDILKVPFKTGADEGLLHFFLQKNSEVQMAVLKDNAPITEGMSEITIPLAGNRSYALMLWQQGNAPRTEIRLRSQALAAPPLSVAGMVDISGFRAARVDNPDRFGIRASASAGTILFSPALEQACTPQAEAPDAARVGPGWLVLTQAGKLRLEPLRIQPGREETVQVGTQPLSLAISGGAGPMLLECESIDSLVGVRVTPASAGGDRSFHWSGSFMQKGLTLAGITDSGTFRGEVLLLPAPGPEGQSAIPASPIQSVTLRLRAFPLQESRDWSGNDSLSIDLKPGQSVRLNVMGETDAYDLMLPQDTAAFCWSGGQAVSMAAAIAGNRQETIGGKPGALFIVNRGEYSVPVRLSRARAEDASSFTLDTNQGVEKVFNEPGRIRISVPRLPADRYVCLFGEDVSGYLLAEDGRLVPGKKMKCLGRVEGFTGGGGLLVVDHGGGFVKVWVSPDGQVEKTMHPDLGKAQSGKWRSGVAVLENALQKWTIPVPEQAALLFSFSSPLAWSAFQDGKPLLYWFKTNSDGYFQFLLAEKGEVTLYTRPLAGRFAEGKVTMRMVRPKDLVPPGPDKELLIASGEAQIFRFPVKVKGKVGIGLRAETDRLMAWLFDHDRNLLATGPLMICDLAPGEYFLVVGAYESPVRYRPVILGSEGSLQEIPEDVLRDYLKK